MNELQVFNNEQFGEIRTIAKNGEPWFVGKDVASALGYANPKNAVAMHVDIEDKTSALIQGPGSNYKSKAIIVNESGLYALVFGSKLERAKEFKHWVTSEVLPSIRKTGTYKAKPMSSYQHERENRLRAELLYKMAHDIPIPEYKQILQSEISKLLLGYAAIPLPAVERPTYSAGEAGAMLGISANKFGRLTKAHGLRTEEHGKVFYDKSRYSAKEVETFRYYQETIEEVRKILLTEVA